jgi:nuclease HARBI1
VTPLANPRTAAEQRYNRYHKSTRRLVECTFGIWKERFPCLNHLRLKPTFAAKVVLACAALHNCVNLEEYVVEEDQGDESEGGADGNDAEEFQDDASGKARQRKLISYFN